MLYQGKQIGTKPSIEMCNELINKMHLDFKAEDFYQHYDIKKWLTSKGTEPLSLEGLVISYNGMEIQKKRKEGIDIPKKKNDNQLYYAQLLKDRRWLKREMQIMHKDNYKCVICGAEFENTNLNVHHKKYNKELMPWEYEDTDLITLCNECHRKVHQGLIKMV